MSIIRCCIECNCDFSVESNKDPKKFCNLSCSSKNQNKVSKQNKTINYLKNPKHCKQCSNIIEYDKRNNNFCNRSCSAIYTNAKKDFSKIKTGPAKGTPSKTRKLITKIKQCIICGKFHPKNSATCSRSCLSIHISNLNKGKTGGYIPNIEYYDSFNNHCFLDSMWELILANSLDKNNIKWLRPMRFIFKDGHSYTPDFYLIDYNIFIDPKAMRMNYYRDSKLKVQKFEIESGNKCLIITKEKYLTWWHIQSALLLDLHWS